MYEEMDKETKEMLLNTLAERTLTGKQQWGNLDYKPISFIQETDNFEELSGVEKADAFVSQMFEMETEFNGWRYSLELMEQINFPSGKGDFSGTLTFEDEPWDKYDFALSFDERYEDVTAKDLKKAFAEIPVVKLAEAVVTFFEGTKAVEEGFSYAEFMVQEVDVKWKGMPLVKLCKKLMDEKRMQEFHRIVLDVEYRKKLMGE